MLRELILKKIDDCIAKIEEAQAALKIENEKSDNTLEIERLRRVVRQYSYGLHFTRLALHCLDRADIELNRALFMGSISANEEDKPQPEAKNAS